VWASIVRLLGIFCQILFWSGRRQVMGDEPNFPMLAIPLFYVEIWGVCEGIWGQSQAWQQALDDAEIERLKSGNQAGAAVRD